MSATTTGIGAPVRRKEDFRFITGHGQYTDDVVRPGETRAVFVRSPHAHAKIKSIDVSAAKKMPEGIGQTHLPRLGTTRTVRFYPALIAGAGFRAIRSRLAW